MLRALLRRVLQLLRSPLQAIVRFFGLYQLGPITAVVLANTVALISTLLSDGNVLAADAGIDSTVSGFYGPGAYYAWLINAIAAVCQSQPKKTRDDIANGAPAMNADASAETSTISMYQLMTTLGAAAYPAAAAVDELIRVSNRDFGPSHAAADRVAQVGWILSTFYLLHHIFEGALSVGKAWIPSRQTAVWMALWILITIAMSFDTVVRGNLRSTAIKVFLPFSIAIPIPILAVIVFIELGWIEWNEGWQITMLNFGTFVLSTTYVCCPMHMRYDPGSPMAPKSGSSLREMDQAFALACGIFVVLPTLPALWEGVKRLVR